MTDLTKIDKPFGELDQNTQWALKGAYLDGRAFEFKSPLSSKWVCTSTPIWGDMHIYRLKTEPLKYSATFKMGVAAYPHSAPIISEGHAETEGWHKGTTTVEFEGDDPVRIVWEPSK